MLTDFPRELVTNNAHYAGDYEYSIQVSRWSLRPMGAWPPLSGDGARERIFSRISIVICQSLVAFTVACTVLFIIFEDADLDTKLKAVGPMSHWVMGGMNHCFLLLRAKEIRKCIEHMEFDWRIVKRAGDREEMLRAAKFGRLIAGIAAFVMQLGVFLYCVLKGVTTVYVTVNNKTTGFRPLPCPAYNGLIDTRYSPANDVVFVLQFLSSFVVNSATVGACGLAAILALHACGQLNVVMAWLDDLVDESEKNFVQDKLTSIVKLHLRVLRFVSHIEEVMHQICFVELVGCTFNLCMLGYYCITEWRDQDRANAIVFVMILISMCFNIFIFCYISQNISDRCVAVGEKAYMTNWYRLPNKTALDLILVILRSTVVFRISAGKLIKLSISTFGDVIKTSAAYLNILRTATT